MSVRGLRWGFWRATPRLEHPAGHDIALVSSVFCYYNLPVTTWDEAKRRKNVKDHGLDFADCDAIWDNFTITREDIRQAYGEKRLVTFGMLHGGPVVMAPTERLAGSHVISLRLAEKHEARYYFKVAKDYFK
jgi:uncharacterized protein